MSSKLKSDRNVKSVLRPFSPSPLCSPCRSRLGLHRLPQSCVHDAAANPLGHPLLYHAAASGPRQPGRCFSFLFKQSLWCQAMYGIVGWCNTDTSQVPWVSWLLPAPMCKTHLVSLWSTSNVSKVSDIWQTGKAACSHKGILLPLSTALCEDYSTSNAP